MPPCLSTTFPLTPLNLLLQPPRPIFQCIPFAPPSRFLSSFPVIIVSRMSLPLRDGVHAFLSYVSSQMKARLPRRAIRRPVICRPLSRSRPPPRPQLPRSPPVSGFGPIVPEHSPATTTTEVVYLCRRSCDRSIILAATSGLDKDCLPEVLD